MIRPIETNMSLFTVDHQAHQARNDPNAHNVLAVQQAEAIKKAQHQQSTVQQTPETEGEVKIRDRDSEKNKRDGRKRRRHGNNAEAEDEAATTANSDGDGRLNFLA